jgi:hypothetical protein
MSEGPVWREQRRFSLQVLRDFGVGRSLMEENILSETKLMVADIAKKIESDGSHDFDMNLFIDVCIGSITNMLVFGYRFDNVRSRVN